MRVLGGATSRLPLSFLFLVREGDAVEAEDLRSSRIRTSLHYHRARPLGPGAAGDRVSWAPRVARAAAARGSLPAGKRSPAAWRPPSSSSGPQDGNHQPAPPEKVGWVRKFCGKGIFREIWKNRYVVLKGDQLYISEKEVKDEKNIQEVFDLSDYEKCEELRKSKSRSKKNHSKFTLAHSKQPGNTAPNLIFLAVSPEEKESWISALNSAITRAKNRILDEVTVEEDSYLAHPTRDRAKIQHSRRPPTRGHLMAVASTSTSDGMLTLDLIQEEDPSPEEPASCAESFRVDLDKSVAQLAGSRRRADSDRIQPSADRASSLSRPWEKPDKGATYTPQAPKKLTPTEKGRCASLEEILSQRDAAPARTLQLQAEEPPTPAPPHPGQLSRIQDLVARKLEKTQELLAEVQGLGDGKRKAKDPPRSPPDSESEQLLLETERLLGEASSNWSQAKRVLQEVRELRDLYRQMDLQTPDSHLRQTTPHKDKSTNDICIPTCQLSVAPRGARRWRETLERRVTDEAKGSTLWRPEDGETGGTQDTEVVSQGPEEG
ncbi:PREDICTED: pleckstrin homology domain-containing family O member 1 isoform X3 [Rhinopithecus bieti]|uniref:pleckstrin homology domain-containing family O member 1 isoform X3 n=1 Tax=Rhinopithecus bieti TaxID=61621 RepID=UPI00083C5647|nr:PREDICTED: pleckstrin homology domain-containing family O member 1 isoform X3 [Rhinopithecus bieti]